MKSIFSAKKEDLGSGGITTQGDITDRNIFRQGFCLETWSEEKCKTTAQVWSN